MNSNNKYYTPSIEEFHVGFEYEFCDFLSEKPSEWYERKFGILNNPVYLESASWLFNLESEIDKGNVRVKFLDKEDIEDLGFTKVKDSGGIYIYIKLGKFSYGERWVLLTYQLIDGLQDIETYASVKISIANIGTGNKQEIGKALYHDSNPNRNSFRIKNKSELKRLLKQLGIC